ncbi:hypothetical protein SASPL_140936 [Salvia splendens]|uniref:Secreted protein n=1 Tax=Salvia splendens TaxID=180675 RepID=A0A8X8WRY6_SALSN|nr:hypothetical protein SASPL_140936 [Salvia splendens]
MGLLFTLLFLSHLFLLSPASVAELKHGRIVDTLRVPLVDVDRSSDVAEPSICIWFIGMDGWDFMPAHRSDGNIRRDRGAGRRSFNTGSDHIYKYTILCDC